MAGNNPVLALLRNMVAFEANRINIDLSALSAEVDSIADAILELLYALDTGRATPEVLHPHLDRLYHRLTDLSERSYAIARNLTSALVEPYTRQ